MEIPLEDKELCNVVETLPTVCQTTAQWYEACEFASFYASCVSLLPTHRPETNAVVVRNRRIGVGIIDWTGWILADGLHKVTKFMRKGYDIVTLTNRNRNAQAGVPEAIRKTTIKPGGTTPKLPAKTPGVGYPTFRHTLRRMRAAANNNICPILDAAGVPWEPCYFDPANTRIYEYPTLQGPADPAEDITLWEQAMNLVTVQREWSDNAVSNTLYFKPYWKLTRGDSTLIRDWTQTPEQMDAKRLEQMQGWVDEWFRAESVPLDQEHAYLKWIADGRTGTFESKNEVRKVVVKCNKFGEWELYIYHYDPHHEEGSIEKVCAAITPLTKSYSLLPHTAKGAYRQMPEEGITPSEYERRLKAIKPIDWSTFKDSDGIDERYCQGEACVVPT